MLCGSDHFHLDSDPKMPFSEVVQQFDERRDVLAPYGLTCVRWRATRMARPDRHNEIELNLLETGSLVYLRSGHRIRVRAGTLVVFWAITPHQIVERDGDEPYYVATIPFDVVLRWKLAPAFLSRLLNGEMVEDPSAGTETPDARRFRQWTADLRDGATESREIVLLEMQARLRRMARACAGAGTERGRDLDPDPARRRAVDAETASRVERMAMFVAANYHAPLTVAAIGAAVGLNPDYAAALFRRTFGMTLGRYLRDHRVAHAQRLLTATPTRIGEIAFLSGFESLSRFNAAFRAAVGCTPRAYRKHGGEYQAAAAR
jgi:AraC family transcriptional regulator, melibiose operon regulatory protein